MTTGETGQIKRRRTQRRSGLGLALVLFGLLALPLVVLAADVITNGSFDSNITTGWNDLSNSTFSWDGADGQPANGSLFIESVDKNGTATGYLHQTVAVDSTDVVTMSFYWKKAYVAAAPVTHTLFVEIQKPLGQVVSLWSNSVATLAGPWTLQDLGDLSSTFDQTGSYQIRLGADFLNGNNKNSPASSEPATTRPLRTPN